MDACWLPKLKTMEASIEHRSRGDEVNCSHCGREQLLFGPRCVSCGKPLILSEPAPQAEAQAAASHSYEESYYGEYGSSPCCSPLAAALEQAPEEPEPEPVALGVDAYGLVSLAIGLAAAILSLLFFWPAWIFGHLSIAIHEFGHAAAGWLFGYFSIPAYDFIFGGGVTISSERIWLIVAVVYALFGYAAWRVREQPRLLGTLGVAVAAYTFLMLTSWHEALIIGIGHGAELVFGGIFLYRAIGNRTIVAAAERPVYAFLGFFLLIYNGWLAWRLAADASFRESYNQAKGELLAMDYTRLAVDYWHLSLRAVAIIFFCLTIGAFLAAWIVAVFRRRLVYPFIGE
ncbi:MAG: hypothetical protein C4534_05585 [Gaiellales bacterium]|nr:MAG: hypothetical protein C4534_05585 [Gaiellales bacterium]